MEYQKIKVGEDFLAVSSLACAAGVLALILRYLTVKDPKPQKTALPTLKNPNLTYLSCLKAIYKRRSKDSPFLCLLFECVNGVCKGFEKERIFQFFIGFQPVVVCFKPETVEAVLSSTTLIDKANQYGFLNPWLGTGLLTSSVDTWRHRRKLLTPAFHFCILEDFLPVFNEQSVLLASKIRSLLLHEPWLDIVPLITSCTLDIICETAMGVRINAQGSEKNEYAEAIHELGESFFYRIVRPWLYPDIVFNLSSAGRNFKKNVHLIQRFTRKVIKEKKETMISLENSGSRPEENTDSPSHRNKRLAFLELLLKHHLKDQSLTEDDIRDEVNTFMFEGHDTTAMALSWSLYFLGLDEEVQQNVLNELDDIFGTDRDREVTRQDLTQMKYLECVIKETLRLNPSTPFFARVVREPFRIANYTIEKGSMCLILPSVLHRDGDSFENPEKFIPERFSKENSVGRHPYAYVPFSAGSRNCIGQKFALMEEKTVLANILRRFRVRSLDARDKVNTSPNLVLRNVQPVRLRFIPRDG